MKLTLPNIPKIWKDSAIIAFALIAGIESVMSIAAISFYDTIDKWWGRLLLVIAVYIFLMIVACFVKYKLTKNILTLNIRGIKVIIKQGDIFDAPGWRLIPFAELISFLNFSV